MKTNACQKLIFPGTLFMLAVLITSCTQNWPQFRGPNSNMIATAKNLPDTWSPSENIRWSADIDGESWTSPVVWGNKVFFTSAIPVKLAPEPERQAPPPPSPPAEAGGNAGNGQNPSPPPQTPPDPKEDKSYLEEVYRWEVSCLDLESGEILWTQVAKEGSPGAKKHRATNYASETPVTNGERLYVYFGMNGLYCYDLDGKLLWEKDLGAYFTLNGWGTGSSPVLYKDLLFVQVDNEENSFLVALNAETGEELWKKDREETTNYSTPIIWRNSLRTELVTGGKTARSYDPDTGELIWELKVAGYYNIPSPVAGQDMLYLGNAAYRDTPGTLFCVRAGAEGNISPAEGESTSSGVVWSNPDAPTANPSPLLYEGLLYLLGSRGGEFTCIDAATGEQVYKEKIDNVAACWASPWAYQDKIFLTDEKGVTQVLKAGRDFELLHQNVLDDKIWASVAVTRDAYLMKGTEKIYCIGY
jgi:outer membrane protein assembly factor BamB